MSRKIKVAVRSVRFHKAYECREQYLKDYDEDAVVCTGFWKERERDEGKTTYHAGIEDAWVQIEMPRGSLPSFMQRMGHPVILDVETPEIRPYPKNNPRSLMQRWAIWQGPPRPAYRLTIYDAYME